LKHLSLSTKSLATYSTIIVQAIFKMQEERRKGEDGKTEKN